jgi:8-oxo-dGTP diphosphatase
MKRVHVAVGVLANAQQQVFITQRAQHLHQGGLWEFPGGKVERDETVYAALQREMREELGIAVTHATPLIRIAHDYADKAVLLDVWHVTAWQGTPRSMEAQPSAWVDISRLHDYRFPEANARIVTALRMPCEMMITGHWQSETEFRERLASALQKGTRLVQLRAHQCNEQAFRALAQRAHEVCEAHRAQLMVNTTLEHFEKIRADGVSSTSCGLHLTSAELMRRNSRPVSKNILLGASCHSSDEVQQANRIGADYITLAPVRATTTHPGVSPLGLERFAALAAESRALVYALGGMQPEHQAEITEAGGYGIAAITAWW